MNDLFTRWRKVWVFVGLLGATFGCDSGYSESQSKTFQSPPTGQGTPPGLYQIRLPIGSNAPPFRLMDLNGRPISLSDFQGQVVLLNFWATWCGPCRVEMPAMEELYRNMKSEGLAIVAVSVDEQGTEVTRPFQEALGLSFPILHDQDYQVGLDYGARALPMTYVIDRKGVIRQRVFGARDWNSSEARQGIADLLQEPFQEPSQTM